VSSAFDVPLPKLFSAFDFTPIASASVAQVHKATLAKDGTEVMRHKGSEGGVYK
jgi:predicted unusual protein kinase regulating ubiquinone biosynthesis (AarF/ABC1/UbiB family)